VLGRYAYAVYDEAGLIDLNVGGYPSPTPSPIPATYVQAIGRKGSVAFADLTNLGMSTGAVGDVVGWRNYASISSQAVSPSPANTPSGLYSSYSFSAASASDYAKYVSSRTDGATTVYP